MSKRITKTILIVEDEQITALAQQKELERYGYNTLMVETGELAVEESCINPPFDLVLMDIDLGKGIDGTEAAREILKICDIPIVFLSSHTEEHIVEKTEKISSYGYVVKNTGITVLDASIKMAFKLFYEKKRSEEKQRNLITTLNSIGDAVIATDVHGIITTINPIAENLTGWTRSEAIGQKLSTAFNIVDKTTREPVENPVSQVQREGQIVELADHTVLISKNGEETFIADSAAPIKDEAGNISGIVLVFRDLSDEILAKQLTDIRLILMEYAENHTLDELLTKALDEIEELVHSPIGFYHFVHLDQKSLTLQQWSTRTLNEYCKAEAKGLHYCIDEAGVWVDCVREGKAVIHNNYETLPHKKGLPEGHAPLIRELVVPVMREEKIVAILGVGNKATEYTEKDIEIISYLADVTWEIIHHKRAEEALEKSEKKFRAIVESSPMGMHFYTLIDDELIFQDANRSANTVLGIDNNIFIGKSLEEAFPPLANTEIPDHYRQVAREGGAWKNEQVNYEDDKISGAYEVVAFQIQENQLAVAFNDITEKKQAQDALNKSEKRFRAIFEQAAVGVAQVESKTGNFIHINKRYGDIVGLSKKEMLKINFQKITHPEDLQDDLNNMQRLINGEIDEFSMEKRYFHKDGSVIWVNLTVSPMWQKGEEPTYHIAIVEDITDRIQAQRALVESEERYRRVIEITPVLICTLESNGEITFANKTYAEYFGKTPEELAGVSIYTLIPENDRDFVKSNLASIKPDSPTQTHEHKVIGKNKEIRWMRWSNHALFNSNGEISQFHSIGEDITDRKQSEKNLLDSEIRYRSLMEQSPFSIALYKPDGFLTYGNPASTRIHKISDKELHALYNTYNILEDENLINQGVMPYIKQGFSGKYAEIPAVKYDLTKIKPDLENPIRWIRGFIYPVTDESASITEVALMHEDITEQKKSNFELSMLSDAIENSINSFDIVNEKGELLYVNKAYIDMWGYDTKEEVLGTSPASHCVDPEIPNILISALKKEGQKEIEFEARRKDGTTFLVLMHAYLIEDEDGSELYAGTSIDITERKENEKQINNLLKEKEILLREVHHRIKNNMSTMKHLLSLQALSMEDKKENINTVNALNTAENRMTSMMLLYDKLYKSESIETVSMKEYFSSLVDEIVHTYPEEVKIIKEIDDALIPIRLASPLGIIINELISNSMKYAFGDKTNNTISISTILKDTEVILTIEDNGIGLDADTAIKGFGLTLVETLISQIEGVLDIENRKGTKFIITFSR